MPFGPILLGKLLHNTPYPPTLIGGIGQLENEAIDYWESVSWYTALIFIAYISGRFIGASIGTNSFLVRRRFSGTRTFCRTVGVIVALHLFSFGSGLSSQWSLLSVRFFSALLVGLLGGVTKWNTKPCIKDSSLNPEISFGKCYEDEELEEDDRTKTIFHNQSRVCRVWLIGFGVSAFSGGMLYHSCSRSTKYIALTGKYPWTISLFFFVSVVVFIDVVMNKCLKLSYDSRFLNKKKEFVHQRGKSKQNITTNTDSNSFVSRANHMSIYKGKSSNYVEQDTTYFSRVSLDSNFASSETRPRRNSNDSIRRRGDSVASNDIFYDCSSIHSETSEPNTVYPDEVNLGLLLDDDLENLNEKENEDLMSKYVDGRCIYNNGDSACVPAGEYSATPSRSFFGIFTKEAVTKWENMKRWRIEQNIWNRHAQPHPFFKEIKAAYPHVIHGYNKLGYPVIYEKPGQMKLKELFDGVCEIDDLVDHYIFLMEYFANCICTRPEICKKLELNDSSCPWGFSVIMDFKGLSLKNLNSELLKYLKKSGDINTSYYPSSIQTCLVVNSPFWMSGVFGVIRSAFPKSVDIEVYSSNEGIKNHVDDDQIPSEYGGTSPYKLGEHPYEIGLRELVERTNDGVLPVDRPIKKHENHLNNSHTSLLNSNVKEPKQEECYHPDHTQQQLPKNLRTKEHQIPSSNNLEVEQVKDKTNTHTPSSFAIQIYQHKCSDEFALFIVTILHFVWFALQGYLETAISLWFCSPPILGGLGYSPRITGISIGSVTVVLMFMSCTRISYAVSRIPIIAPIRGYRIGVGLQAILLIVLPMFSEFSTNDNVLARISTIFFIIPLFIASLLGRFSSSNLHKVTVEDHMDRLSLHCNTRSATGRLVNKTVLFFRSGQFTNTVGAVGEMSGAMLVAVMFAWSDHRRPYPDNVLCFFIGAFLCIVLYIISLPLYKTADSEINSKGPNRRTHSNEFFIV